MSSLAIGVFAPSLCITRGPVRFGKGWFSVLVAAKNQREAESQGRRRCRIMGTFTLLAAILEERRRDDNLYRLVFVVKPKRRRGMAGGTVIRLTPRRAAPLAADAVVRLRPRKRAIVA